MPMTVEQKQGPPSITREEFIRQTGLFWQDCSEPETEDLLLVETSDNMVINHSNAIAGKIVAQAKGWKIAWLERKTTDQDLMRAYSSNSVFVAYPKVPVLKAVWFLLLSVYYYLTRILFTENIRAFKYRGITYGDFVYDNYLSVFSQATLHRWDFRVILIFFKIFYRDEQSRRLFKVHPVKGVLTAHYIGLGTGVLTRVALQEGLQTYWKGGGHQKICLVRFSSLKDLHVYPLKPTPFELEQLSTRFKETVEKDFADFISNVDNPFYGAFTVAYNNRLYSDVDRQTFLSRMGLEDKPLYFIMLHCFNDHPLSHFRNMLFRDYYDWFRQTLDFARTDTTKNWIFKEHPANKYYPTKDVDMGKIMNDLPGHIRYLPAGNEFNAATVLNVADMIVTCLGTAGVEMPALRAIPSTLASESAFSGFGFTIEPKTQQEYFESLRSGASSRLTEQQQLRARCCYLYMMKYTSVPFTAGPGLTFEESRCIETLRQVYPHRVCRLYRQHGEQIRQEFNRYVSAVGRDNFGRLLCMDIER